MWRRPAVLVLAVCACATHDAPDTGADAGTEARTADAALDAPDSASSDAPRDVSDAAAADGFVRVTGSFPATSRLEIADPELVASTTFPMEPCPDRTGCRRIVQTWSSPCTGPPGPCSPFAGDEASGHHDGTIGTVIISRQLNFTDIELWAVDDSDHARAGFRSRSPNDSTPPYSSLGAGGTSADSIALSIYSIDASGVAQDFVVVAAYASPLSFVDLGEVSGTTANPNDEVQRMRFDGASVAAEMSSLVVIRIPLDHSAPAVVTGGEGTLGAIAGNTIFFDRYTGGPESIEVARPGAAPEPLITGPQMNQLRLATDGVAMAWLGADDDGHGLWTNFEVWASPYAEHAADLTPRLLDRPPTDPSITASRRRFGSASAM